MFILFYLLCFLTREGNDWTFLEHTLGLGGVESAMGWVHDFYSIFGLSGVYALWEVLLSFSFLFFTGVRNKYVGQVNDLHCGAFMLPLFCILTRF